MIPLHVVSTVVQRGNNSTLTEAPMFKKNPNKPGAHTLMRAISDRNITTLPRYPQLVFDNYGMQGV